MPLRIVGGYLLIGGLWIKFSDRLILLLGSDIEAVSIMQTYKGWFYVAVTAVLLWWQIRGYLSRIQAAERELRESNEALTSVLAAAPVAICVIDTQGRIRSWNQAAQRIFGWSEEEVVGAYLQDYPDSEAGELRMLLQKARSGDITSDMEIKLKTKEGQRVEVSLSLAPLHDESGSVSGVVIAAADITDRKAQEQKIRQLELIDPLTGIFNRQALERQLHRVIDHIEKSDQAVLMVLAVDNFKLVNESLGHNLGDLVLAELTSLLTQSLPNGAVFGRWSGDEIAVILENTALPQAERIAEGIRQTVETRRFVGGANVTVSIGLVAIEAAVDFQRLLSFAAEALFHAKGQGRNRVVAYRQEEQHGRILSMASRLTFWIREGSLKDRIMLYFQPIVNLATGQVDYYEVLLRVKGQEGEVILPKDFIPVAERFGLMPQVDYCVVEKAVGLLDQHPEVRMFVNLSGSSMSDLELLSRIEALLRKRELGPGQLTFEVTESVAITDMEKMYQWMHRLRELGCRFALDDFGVGFSTFSNLRAIPVDWIKIDGSFVRNIESDLVSRKLVAAISSVAHSLDKKVVAEWIEEQSAIKYIADLGIEYGQGYYWGHPSPSVAAAYDNVGFSAQSEAACSIESP